MIARDRLDAAIEVHGPHDATPLLLVHGLHLGRFSWRPHVEQLQNEFRVITFDMPRHGALADVTFSREHLFELLDYICEHVTEKPPLIVGYSLGGYIAMLYAAHRPENLSGLLLTGATLELTSWRSPVYRAIVNVSDAIPDRFFDWCSAAFFRATLPADLAEAIIAQPFNHCVFSEAKELIDGVAFSEVLARYSGPVEIANGQYDVAFRPQTKRFATRANAQARIVRGSDHVFPLRRPQQFCEIIRQFSRCLHAAA